MKEATGELNMTVITIVAIAAVVGLFYAFIWPAISGSMRLNACKNICPGGDATAFTATDGGGGTCTCGDGTTLTIDAEGNLTEGT